MMEIITNQAFDLSSVLTIETVLKFSLVLFTLLSFVTILVMFFYGPLYIGNILDPSRDDKIKKIKGIKMFFKELLKFSLVLVASLTGLFFYDINMYKLATDSMKGVINEINNIPFYFILMPYLGFFTFSYFKEIFLKYKK